MTPPGDDHYAVLGVPADADLDVIRSAYRRHARTTHPDRGGSAEDFYRVQQAWEVLSSPERRADYDRRRSPAAGSQGSHASQGSQGSQGRSGREEPGERSTFTYSPSGGIWSQGSRSGAAPGSAGGTQRPASRAEATPSGQALAAPVYEPDLSSPHPLSLAVTSQKVHGEFTHRGMFGGGRARRIHERSTELLTRHVLDELPAARLFVDVALPPAERTENGRLRGAKNIPRADFVVVCGHALSVVSVVEATAEAVSWDGSSIRTAGRRIPIPDGAGAAHELQRTLVAALGERYGRESLLTVSHQVMLLGADRSLLSPAVQLTGPAARTGQGPAHASPLAPGRAAGRIVGELGTAARPNLVDRYLLAALREQLCAPDQEWDQ